ncbi:hypothetical protein CAB90_03456 [Mycobacterium tuberculosis]|uniref:Uncharacterized protein n=1 Tax=Mycobacterium tuberculosis TaxID=1773 RepID=A0A2I7WBG2_MYCTX|nr:hypothetical protein CAB90_03456 [Mycobacterium tuberculosis]
MQFRHPVRPATFEATVEKVGEHLVEAKPIRVVFGPLQEQAAVLGLFQHRPPIGDPGQRRGQPAARAFGDRCHQ